MIATPVLSAEGIVKQYPGVLALDAVDFTVLPGEVHGLIGENGAGKTTLMHILAGITYPDAGVIRFDGKPVQFSQPREAMDCGIAIVHQELNLVPHLSVAENIFLGKELVSAFGAIRTQEQNQRCSKLLSTLDATIDPCAKVHSLRVGQQQVVEIAKVLNSSARVIFMDEPTSAISDHEVGALFALIDSLCNAGVSIVYVSHKLDELLQISDRITVLRDGRLVATLNRADADQDTVVRLMVGRQLSELYVHSESAAKEQRLRVESLTLKGEKAERPIVEDVSFSVDSGEVLGVYGLMGAGRSELLESIFGLHPVQTTGAVYLDGNAVTLRSAEAALQYGPGLVPEDRQRQGLVLGLSVEQNISLSNLDDLTQMFLLSSRLEREQAEMFVEQFAIRSSDVSQRVGSLSGGNQQKVVLSKVLATRPRVLMLDEPTRGIDVKAKRDIYALIDRSKQEGLAVVVVSSELPELLGIADRMMVMCEGRKTAEFDRSEANEELLMRAAVPGVESNV